MMRYILKYLIALCVTVMLASCAQNGSKTSHAKSSHDSSAFYTELNQATHQTATNLTRVLHLPIDTDLEPPALTLVTSYVNIDNFNQSSSFGRTVAEQVSSGLISNGLLTKEVRLSDKLKITPEQGELMLSRELKNIAKEHHAKFVLIGTYTEAAKMVYVSSKLVLLENDTVVSAYNFSLDKDENIASLLHGVKKEDLYPVISDNKDDMDEGFGNGGGNRTLMDAIREYDKKINDSRKKKGAY